MSKQSKSALQNAIEAMEKLQDGFGLARVLNEAISECKAALEALAKCEPVAWRLTHHDGSYEIVTRESWQNVRKSEPLYTSPQPRDWVSLSEDEIYESVDDHHETFFKLARAIEVKLKQLNTTEKG